MKKTVTGLLLSVMILLGISFAGNITVEDKSSTSSCNSSETVNKYLYLSPGEYTVSDKPWDTFKNTVDSLIKKGSTSVQIWRNGVIVDCNDWNTSSIVVSSTDTNGASIIVNKDGCDFDKPSYTKTGNPTAIDAQIHYTIGYARVWEDGSKTYNGKLYHKDYTDTNWTCYPGGNKVTDNQECPNVTVKYVDETKYHVGECINYRVFRCGDGLVNRPGSVTYDNGYHYEACDPESPDWKNRADGKTCSAKCEIVEPVIKEDPVCNSTYNNQTKYTDTSAVWLSSSDDLCSKGEVKNFKYSGEPRTFTWDCEKDGTTTGCTAKQQRCGDGEKNGTEECDPNDKNETNWGNDGCSLSCKKKIEVVSVCDEEHTYYRKLRHLSGYIFEDNFSAGSADRRLYGTPDVKFEEKMDYNRGANPTFNWTSRLINNDMKVSAGEKRLIVESTPEYVIKDHPVVREKDNLYIEYTLKYANKKYSTTPDESKLKTHKECVYYEISRCGDGMLDIEHGEECDPGSEGTKVLPDGRICNSDCKIGDTPTKGKAKIEKTLKNKVAVEYTGQTLKWTVKVTAEGGDVTDFEVRDLLPEALDYVDYKVTYNQDNLTVKDPTGPVKSGSNNVYTWEVKGTLEKNHVLEIEVETKVNKMPKTDDDYRNIACVVDDGDKDCDEDKPDPTKGKAEIEKTLKDKVAVEYTGQTLKWTIRVTAKSGDVTDFEVRDLLPEALDYVDYKVTYNQDNLTVKDPTGPVKSGSNNVYTWEVKGTLENTHVLEIEVETKVNKMPKTDDDYRNIACVVDDGDKDCDEDKPDPAGGIKIEKTLKDKIIVTKTGEILTWTVRVTATSGNVTDFEIKDLVPPVLKYKGYKVTYNQDNLTVKDPTGPVTEGINNVYTWEVEGTLEKNHVLEMEIETEVIKMPRAGDDNRNVACVIYESTKDCDPEDIPYIWIKKTFSDGSKEVKTVKIGEKIAYKIAFGNSGQVNATITSIKDFLPKNVEYESSTISINGYNHDEIEIGNGIIEKSQETREGVQIDTFTGITLKPGDTGYIILTGVVKSEFTGDRTNFACIYLNDKQIDCDDVKHDISTDVSCKPTLSPSSFGDVECSNTSPFSTTVTCSSTGGKADLEIICNGTVIKTGHDEKITGTCTGTANNTDYKVQCKINGSFTGVNGESCDGSFRRGCYNPGSSCFVAGTKVLMANGSEKNIEDVDIGDKLLGSDGSINTVKGFDRPKLGERKLRSINGSKYFVSDEHPFKTTDGWKAFDPVMARLEIVNALAQGWLVRDDQTEDLLNITELKLGDVLLKKNGLGETVVSLSSVTSDPNTQLYNFVLDGDNTYFADGYLVHNKGGGGGGSTSPRCDSLEPENSKMVCRSNKNAYLTMYCDGLKVEQLKDEKGTVLKYNDYSDCKKIECYVSDTKLNGRNGDKCERKNEQTEGTQLCINVNAGNFSLEEGEIFPFYWNLRNMSNVYKKANNYTEMNGDYRNAISNYNGGGECSESKEGKIAKDSMICEFNIYDGKEYHKGKLNGIPLNKPLYTIEGPCLSETSVIDTNKDTNKLIKARYNEMKDIYCNNPSDCDFYDSTELPTAVYYIQKFGSGATVHLNVGSREGDWSMTRKDESKKSYGEYKIELSEIKYLVCENGSWQKRKASEDSDFVGCQGDLMLTNPYTVQKTPSGNLTASTNELKKYLYYDGSSTFDKLLNAIESTDYKPNAKVEEAMDKFIDKYKKLAVKVNLKGDSFLEGTNVSKVPGKHIYFVDGPITVKGGNNTIDTPFTIVQIGGNTTINGNVGHNMMLLTKGNIIFQGNCKEDQEVKGIFYAGGNLSRNGVAKNTDTTVGRWCRKGGLHVKGVLIGNNFKNLMLESRSNINDWFIVRGSDQEVLNQRRRYVMNGASVVIEYSPSIFTKSTMPPGAEDFTTALSIYKN